MASEQVIHDFPGFFKVFEDGRVQRYWNSDYVDPGLNSEIGVQSKDVEISRENGVKARIFLPKLDSPAQKFPLVVHYHGGAFCLASPFSTMYNIFFSTWAAQARVIIMSVDYRLAPENKLPTAYDDSWAGLQWVANHSGGNGPEPWINQHADLGRVILAGESAGANIAHYVAVLAGATGLASITIRRLLIVHPNFGKPEPDNMFKYMHQNSSGGDDEPKFNVGRDPNLSKLKCDKLLLCVAEIDELNWGAMRYYETMRKLSLGGQLELYETKGEGHCFFYFNPTSPNIAPFMKKLCDFVSVD